MDLSRDTDDDLRMRLAQIDKEISNAEWRLSNRKEEPEAIEKELVRRAEEARIALLPPVNRSARALASGEPESAVPDYRDINPATGMQKEYIVLTKEERERDFVRPLRDAYRHLKCWYDNDGSEGPKVGT